MSAAAIPTGAEGVLVADLGDRVALVGRHSRRLVAVDRRVASIWRDRAVGIDVDRIVDRLVRTHDADPTLVRADVGATLDRLAEAFAADLDPEPVSVPLPGPAGIAATGPVLGPHGALDLAFDVVAEDAEVSAVVSRLFAGSVPPSTPTRTVRYHVTRAGRRFVLAWSAPGRRPERVGRWSGAADLAAGLVSRVNLDAVAASRHRPVLHAAAVRTGPGGPTVALAGASGHGKSTLAGRLAATGWRYVGDELVTVDPDGTAVVHHKPLVVESGSFHVLAHLADRALVVRRGRSWLVPAAELDHPATVEGRSPLAAVVVTRHDPEAAPEARWLDGLDALDAVLAHTFALDRVDQDAFGGLVDLCRRGRVGSLVHGGDPAELDGFLAEVVEPIGTTPTRRV